MAAKGVKTNADDVSWVRTPAINPLYFPPVSIPRFFKSAKCIWVDQWSPFIAFALASENTDSVPQGA